MTSLKGIGCNRIETPLAPYNLEWWHTSFGQWCWNWAQYPVVDNWVIYLFEKIPTQQQLLDTLPNPFHGLWWGVGNNEVDIRRHPFHFTTQDVQNEAQFISAQIAAVTAVQPNAKFALAASTQEHSPNNPFNYPCWHDALWAVLPQSDKDKIKALRLHWYPQVQFWEDGDPRTFNKNPIKQELNRYKTWAVAQGRADLQIWLDEIGLVWNGVNVVPTNPEVNSYAWVVQQACDEVGIERWSWFGFDHTDRDYVSLWNNGITQFGQAFAAL